MITMTLTGYTKAMLWVFIVEFLIGAVLSMLDHNHGMMVYYLGAAILNIGLVML